MAQTTAPPAGAGAPPPAAAAAPPTTMRRVLLIGGTGNGKSTLGNVMMDRNVFAEGDGAASETRLAQMETVDVEGTRFVVVDTVGLGDTGLSKEAVCMRIADACVLCREGINQILFVTRSRFTKTELSFFCMMRDVLLGRGVVAFTTVVRTHSAKAHDPAWCEKTQRELAELGGEDFRGMRYLFVNHPAGEEEHPQWEQKRQESRAALLAYLQTCTDLYTPPSLQRISESVGQMVAEERQREQALRDNERLRAENEQQQKENAANAQVLATLQVQQAELVRQREAEQKRIKELEESLARQAAMQPVVHYIDGGDDGWCVLM